MNSGLGVLMRPLIGLAGSLLASRVISGAALIAFAKLAGPEPFAPFGLYLSIVTIMWVVVCGRYEQAIVFAASNREAEALSWLATFIGAAVVVATLLIGSAWLLLALPFPQAISANTVLALAAPFSLAVRAGSRILLNLATREGNFTVVAQANWAQSIVQATLQIGLLSVGLAPIWCLVLADVCGLVAAGALVARTSPIASLAFSARPLPLEITAAAASWQMMPAWNMPTSLLSVVALNVPAILIPIAYPAALAGQLVLGMRLLEVPTNILASAATPILQRQLAASRDRVVFIWQALALITCIAAAAFTGIAIVALATEHLFASTRWQVAIAAIPWVAPYFAALAVSGPLVDLVAGLRSERQAVWCHAVFMILTLTIATLAHSSMPWPLLLAAFGAAMLMRAGMFSTLLIKRAAAAR